jgi:hypothetical protein
VGRILETWSATDGNEHSGEFVHGNEVPSANAFGLLLGLVAFFAGLALYHLILGWRIDRFDVVISLIWSFSWIGTEARAESGLTAREYDRELSGPGDGIPFAVSDKALTISILEPNSMIFRRQLVAVVDPDHNWLLDDRDICGIIKPVSLFIPQFSAALLLEYNAVLGNLSAMGLHVLLKAFAGSAISTREPVVTTDYLVYQLEQMWSKPSHHARIFVLYAHFHGGLGINGIVVAEAMTTISSWTNVTEGEIEFPIEPRHCGTAAGDKLFAAIMMAEFTLRIVASRFITKVSPGSCYLRVSEIDKLARKALVFGK